MATYELLTEVSPAVPASGGSPARSAEYATTKFKDFVPDSELTLYDTFEKSCSDFAGNPRIGYRAKDKNGNVWDYTFTRKPTQGNQ